MSELRSDRDKREIETYKNQAYEAIDKIKKIKEKIKKRKK